MKKRYKLSCGMDMTLTLDIDTDVMTPELAQEVNSFWSGAEEVLDASDGDITQAVARRAASYLWSELQDGWRPQYVTEQLAKAEGWPPQHGITIVDYEIPDMDPVYLEVELLKNT